MTDPNRPFPIVITESKASRCTIPWWLAEIAYEYYSERFGKDQSLERLAERGGFGREELVNLLRRQLR